MFSRCFPDSSWKNVKDPHPQDKIQHLDFTKDPRPLYYKTPSLCILPQKFRNKAVFRSLARTKIGAESKTGRFLSKAEILGVGVFSPLQSSPICLPIFPRFYPRKCRNSLRTFWGRRSCTYQEPRKGRVFRRGFFQNVRLSWLWRSECQMYCWGNILGYFLFPSP